MEEKIKAHGHIQSIKMGINLRHPFFKHLSEKEQGNILAEFCNEESFFITLTENGNIFGAAILSICPDRIHVREVGGDYLKTVNNIKYVANKIAKFLDKKYISFKAENEIIKKRSERYGFKPDPNFENEFIKEVQ